MDKPIYRMSESGYCPKVLGAIRLGYEPLLIPGWLTTIMRESKRHEEWVIQDLIDEGYEVETCDICPQCLEELGEEREGIHVELDYPLFRLIGHLDGRVPDNGKKRPLEVKALGRFTFVKFESEGFLAFPRYADQETCYLTAVGEKSWPGFYIVKNRDTGKKLPFDVLTPPSSMDIIIEKLNWVEANARQNRLVDAQCEEDDFQQCSFRYLCMGEEAKPVDFEVTQEVLEALRIWREGSAIVKQVDKAREIIKKFMIDRGFKDKEPLEAERVVAKLYPASRLSYVEEELRKYLSADVLATCAKRTVYKELRLKTLEE